MMIGIGIPINQSNNPRPNPTAVLRLLLCPIENAEDAVRFLSNNSAFFAAGRVSGLAPIAHDEARRAETVASQCCKQLIAVEPGRQSTRRKVERQHVDDIVVWRIGRRSARAGVTG